MGCDIHMHVEKKVGGRWEPVTRTEFERFDRDDGKAFHFREDYYAYEDRNYDLFAMLADVRNGRGFAGIPTGEGFDPICVPKGFPEDAHYETREAFEKWDGDGHSHSHLTLTELLAYDWDGQKTQRGGVMSVEEYEQWQLDKEKDPTAWPRSFSGDVSGRDVVKVTEGDYRVMKKAGTLPTVGSLYIRAEWGTSYRDAAGEAWFKRLDRLKELAAAEPTVTYDDVRIVFWFDN
jgi:hypothetical protein